MSQPVSESASAPQEVVWWDRLLIRVPGYSLFAWLGAYGMYQAGDITLGTAALLFFALALPLLAGWQIFQVLRSRRRIQLWRNAQRISQGSLGVPNVAEIRTKLDRIISIRAHGPEPKKPRFGGLALFAMILGIAGIAITAGILLAKLGLAGLSTFVVIGLLVVALRPLQLMGVQNRAYRAVVSIPRKIAEVRNLVVRERQVSSGQRSTQAADSALDSSLMIIDAAIAQFRSGNFRASADCVDLLVLLAGQCWLPGSKPRILAETLHSRVNAALGQLSIEERNASRWSREPRC
ncbi:hypothetical protein [Glutamicibacter sp. NPDC087583]|uniref:hypothetical protein n=1 Tax=Glutamicibacter sp. NPDC087583 TaxID=3363995 RepID=UPI00381E4EF6